MIGIVYGVQKQAATGVIFDGAIYWNSIHTYINRWQSIFMVCIYAIFELGNIFGSQFSRRRWEWTVMAGFSSGRLKKHFEGVE